MANIFNHPSIDIMYGRHSKSIDILDESVKAISGLLYQNHNLENQNINSEDKIGRKRNKRNTGSYCKRNRIEDVLHSCRESEGFAKNG